LKVQVKEKGRYNLFSSELFGLFRPNSVYPANNERRLRWTACPLNRAGMRISTPSQRKDNVFVARSTI